MKLGLYPKLAREGIGKNRRLYVPYILTCVGMVMMFYIIESLSTSPLLREMKGGGNVGVILTLGKFVIAVFALIFLFYTNSFLIRRRYKEFGLYNVLGMGKTGIARIIIWESLMVDALSLALGLAMGIAFCKFAELGLLNALRERVDYRFTVSAASIRMTLIIYGVIFVLLLFKSLLQVRRARPLELLRSESAGEKPPRANWLLTIPGVLLLGGAYCIAVSIKSPFSAILLFFVAVIMVIVATYLLFTAGSVALCRALQHNKGYYYKKNHFVSVSSMAFRMKRNGAGLASICILCTMVLVMISSSGSLYIGAEDSINARYPRDNELCVNVNALANLDENQTSRIRAGCEQVFADYGVTPEHVLEYRYCDLAGVLVGDTLHPERDGDYVSEYEILREMTFVSVADYNAAMGTDENLEPGEILLCTRNCDYGGSTLSVGEVTFAVKERITDYPTVAEVTTSVIPSLLAVVSDYEVLEPLRSVAGAAGQPVLNARWYYAYDLEAGEEESLQVLREQVRALDGIDFIEDESGGYSYSYGCRSAERSDFYGMYGALFFIGIILSIVFLFAAVLIIYYKQISEGYEDQSRFAIMQKVGMTKGDIRKSINSQVLTVFFAPLILAGIHLCFAYPLVWKILQLFNLHNLRLVVLVTLGAFLLFAVFYAIVYRLTSNVYYHIVSGGSRE